MSADPKSPDPERSSAKLAAVLDQLACPACHGDLAIAGANVICIECQNSYPIIDGIPVLIAMNSEHTTAE